MSDREEAYFGLDGYITDITNPDTDGDGYCDGNVTIVNVCEAVDEFPLDSSEWLDTDGDGIGNEADTDDDNDGLNDTEEEKRGSAHYSKIQMMMVFQIIGILIQ